MSLVLLCLFLATSISSTASDTPSVPVDHPGGNGSDAATGRESEITDLQLQLDRVRGQVEWLTKDNEDLMNKNKILVRALQEEEQARNTAALTIQNLLQDVKLLRDRLDRSGDTCEKDSCPKQ